MTAGAIEFSEVEPGLGFGSRVWGATRENLAEEAVRARIMAEFEDRGLLIFEQVEQTPEMQLAVSAVIGELKDHPVAAVPRAGEDLAPGIIDLTTEPGDDQNVVEFGGRRLSNWLPWHFDHTYNNELNRAGVLRPVTIAPDGGQTGFADGIALYEWLDPELRQRIEGMRVIYTLDLRRQNFGRPPGMREVAVGKSTHAVSDMARDRPRSLHPAVWTRRSGEKVLHVSTLHSVGLEGREDEAGNALFEAVCQAVNRYPHAYFHSWKPNQMLTWDNWRMLHCVTGTDPGNVRRMHRTTIKGDYGLGCFEGEDAPLAASQTSRPTP